MFVKMIPNTFSYNHKLPDFYIACFKQQMDMVCHQTIRMQPTAIFTQ